MFKDVKSSKEKNQRKKVKKNKKVARKKIKIKDWSVASFPREAKLMDWRLGAPLAQHLEMTSRSLQVAGHRSRAPWLPPLLLAGCRSARRKRMYKKRGKERGK